MSAKVKGGSHREQSLGIHTNMQGTATVSNLKLLKNETESFKHKEWTQRMNTCISRSPGLLIWNENCVKFALVNK